MEQKPSTKPKEIKEEVQQPQPKQRIKRTLDRSVQIVLYVVAFGVMTVGLFWMVSNRGETTSTAQGVPTVTATPMINTKTPIIEVTATAIPSATTPVTETVIAKFDVPVGELAISPDDKMLAMSAIIAYYPEQGGHVVKELWTVDLESQQVNQLDVYGSSPVWSPDGNQLLFQSRDGEQIHLNLVDADGQNEKTLLTTNRSDLIDFYWDSEEGINTLQTNGIYRIGSSGNLNKKADFFTTTKSKMPRIIETYRDVSIAIQGMDLVIIRGGTIVNTVITLQPQQVIDLAIFSPDFKWIAYVIREGPDEELWISDLNASSASIKYHSLEGGHIRNLTWTPDSENLVFGWRSTGTSFGDELNLSWLDIQSGQFSDMEIYAVDRQTVFDSLGEVLFYGRTFYSQPSDVGKTTLYQFEVQKREETPSFLSVLLLFYCVYLFPKVYLQCH